jgi:hypothetical protein
MSIQIENPFNQEVVQKIIHMYDENFSPHVRIPHYKLKKRIYDQTYQILSYKDQNEWIGFALISLSDELHTIFIDYLCIDKKFQKGGFGKRFLQQIHLDTGLFSDFHFTILECEDYLVKYYEKNNYQKIPRKYPLENSRPLFMLYRKRFQDTTPKMVDMYHKFILFGLLFNGEIIIVKDIWIFVKEIIDLLCGGFHFMKIMNFKATHT